jgi:O-antigen ligase
VVHSPEVARFSVRDALLSSAVAVLFIAMHATAVNTSAAGPIVVLLIALAGVFSPFSWMLFISGSQIAPDPVGFPLTTAQVGVITWVITLPWNGGLKYISALGPFVAYIAAFAVWFTSAFVVCRHALPLPMLSAMLVGMISFTYAVRVRGRAHVLLLMLMVGTGLSLVGFWATSLKLDVAVKTYDNLVGDISFIRVGSGRGDANDVGLHIPVFIIGILALAGTVKSWVHRPGRRPFVLLSAVVALALGVPALMDTFSRGGIYSFILALCGLVAIFLCSPPIARPSAMQMGIGAVLVIAGIGIFASTTGRSFSQWVEAVQSRNRSNEILHGTSGMFAGRLQPWTEHLKIMLEYPIAGIYIGEFWDLKEYGAGRIGIDKDVSGAAHNVFIDCGSSSGIPGFLLFIVLFFRAPYQLIRRAGMGFAAPFIAVTYTVFLAFMSLSVGNWKTYWAILAVLVSAVECARQERGLYRPLECASLYECTYNDAEARHSGI